MKTLKITIALLLCINLSGCWFVYVPSSVFQGTKTNNDQAQPTPEEITKKHNDECEHGAPLISCVEYAKQPGRAK